MSECIERSLTTKVNAFLICLMRAAHLSLQLARPKATATTLWVSVCVCVAQVCASSSVCVCVCVSQSISLWLIMRTSLNKSSTTFQCHTPQLKDHSLISLAGCCPSPPLCAYPSAPIPLRLFLPLPLLLPCSVPVPVTPCQSVLPACLPVLGASIILCRHNLTTGNAAHNKAKTTPTQQQHLKGCGERNWN